MLPWTDQKETARSTLDMNTATFVEYARNAIPANTVAQNLTVQNDILAFTRKVPRIAQNITHAGTAFVRFAACQDILYALRVRRGACEAGHI